jgi:hypothetical protein
MLQGFLGRRLIEFESPILDFREFLLAILAGIAGGTTNLDDTLSRRRKQIDQLVSREAVVIGYLGFLDSQVFPNSHSVHLS